VFAPLGVRVDIDERGLPLLARLKQGVVAQKPEAGTPARSAPLAFEMMVLGCFGSRAADRQANERKASGKQARPKKLRNYLAVHQFIIRRPRPPRCLDAGVTGWIFSIVRISVNRTLVG
jgi:hypothetical protein